MNDELASRKYFPQEETRNIIAFKKTKAKDPLSKSIRAVYSARQKTVSLAVTGGGGQGKGQGKGRAGRGNTFITGDEFNITAEKK